MIDSGSGSPTWSSWREALGVCTGRHYLKKTVSVALMVGTILFSINHLDEVLRGRATAVTWLKSAFTYLVPFCVSNAGVLIATRRRSA